jgi:flagellar biosynthesis/type III secretory pathway protein FliH
LSSEHLSTSRPPTSARLVEAGLETWLDAELEARETTAHRRGEEAGRESANATSARALDAAAERLDAARAEAAAGLAGAAVELAVAIARELVLVEVDAGRYDLERLVRDSLAVADVGRAECVVHLNPVDVEALADVRFRSGTRLEPDGEVPRGHVHVSTPHGLLVRDLDSAIESVRERILEELRS